MVSTRNLLSLLLVAALVAAQWAGHLHALSHAKYDLAVTLAAGHGAGEGSHAPPLGHSADHCVAFHALDNVASSAPVVVISPASACAASASQQLVLLRAELVPYSSRAPPSLS